MVSGSDITKEYHALSFSVRCAQTYAAKTAFTLLHGDNPQVVFLVDPHEERFLVVVVDSASLWPVTVRSTWFEKSAVVENNQVGDAVYRQMCRMLALVCDFTGAQGGLRQVKQLRTRCEVLELTCQNILYLCHITAGHSSELTSMHTQLIF